MGTQRRERRHRDLSRTRDHPGSLQSRWAGSALTGRLTAGQDFYRGDFRATNPRFSTDNLGANLQPVEKLVAMAEAKGCRPGQLALAWLLAQPFDIAPIPGTKRAEFVRENIAATSVAISADDVAHLSEAFAPGRITGERYAPAHARTITCSRHGIGTTRPCRSMASPNTVRV